MLVHLGLFYEFTCSSCALFLPSFSPLYVYQPFFRCQFLFVRYSVCFHFWRSCCGLSSCFPCLLPVFSYLLSAVESLPACLFNSLPVNGALHHLFVFKSFHCTSMPVCLHVGLPCLWQFRQLRSSEIPFSHVI